MKSSFRIITCLRRTGTRLVLPIALGMLVVGAPAASASSYTISPGGAAIVVTTTSPGESATASFAGTAGQRVSVRATLSNISSAVVTLRQPDGTTLGSMNIAVSGGFMGAFTLPVDGSYRVVVNPNSTYTGHLTLQVYDVPADAAVAATSGVPATVTMGIPGQNGQVTIAGTAGHRLSMRITGGTIPISNVSIRNPDGTVLRKAAPYGKAGGWVEPFALPQTGTYVVRVDPQSVGIGSMTMALYEFAGDQSFAIAPNATPQPVSFTIPGQNALLALAGTAGDRVSLTVTSSSISQAKLQVKRPDGTVFVPLQTIGTGGAMIEPLTLPATGNYQIVVDPTSYTTGNLTVTAYTVPADQTATATTDGTPSTLAFSVPGQNGDVRFTGAAGDQIAVQIGSTVASTTEWVTRPGGAVLIASAGFGMSGRWIDTFTLPADGTYRVRLDPQSFYLGSLTVRAYTVPADVSVATAIGTGQSLSVATPGQNARFTFAGSTGDRISMTVSAVTIGSASTTGTIVSLQRPDGSTLVSGLQVGTNGRFVDPVTLPTTGTYRFVVDPQGANVGGLSMSITQLPSDVVSTIAAGGGPVAIANTMSGQNMRLTFPGSAGQRISLVVNGVTIGSSSTSGTNVWISRPDGSTLVSTFAVGTSGHFVEPVSLPTTGTYSIRIDPQGALLGSATFTLYTVPADQTGTITENGPQVTVTNAVPGQNAKLTFTGSGSDQIHLSAVAGTCCATRVSILRPNGTTLVASTLFNPTGTINVTLALNGVYTILIDPQGWDAGGNRFSLTKS